MFYLDNVIHEENGIVKNVIEILRARGFLIEEIEGQYYLSDNATVEDAYYLRDLMLKYSIGTVINDEEYCWSSRRCWQKDATSRKYSYKSLKPKHVKILVNENIGKDCVFQLFNDMKQNGSESGGITRTWRQFALELLGPKPCVSWLEGYVAFYVKAVSSCGVYTCFSCDGNHDINGGKIYVYADYPSNIWHEFLWNYIVCREFGQVEYIGNGIDVSDVELKRNIYSLLYDISVYLYCNRIAIRTIKGMTVQNITNIYLNHHTKDQVEEFYKSECMRILSDEKNYQKLIARKELSL